MKKTGCAIVTGGSRGIGAACVRSLASEGYDVVINYVSDRGKEKGEELCDEVKSKYNINAICVKGDVSDYQQCEQIVQTAIDTFGKIAILVNNAGVTRTCLFKDSTEDEYRRLIDINMFSALHCSRLVLPFMIKEQFGCIINIGSTGGLEAVPGRVDYTISKAGLIGLTKGLAAEYAKDNITVNYIAPGLIDTDIITRDPDPEKHKRKMELLTAAIPLGRLGTPQEIGDAVRFIVNSRFMTGQVLAINGGQFHH